jgi:hypothetical protein
MKTQKRDGMLGFHPYLDIRHNQDGRVASSKRRLHFTRKKIPWYSFLLQAEWTPGLLNANRRNRSFENFEGLYWYSNPEPPVLWHSASTNCTCATDIKKNTTKCFSVRISEILVATFNRNTKKKIDVCLLLGEPQRKRWLRRSRGLCEDNIKACIRWDWNIWTGSGQGVMVEFCRQWRSWLRHCAASRKVAGSIPDEVIGIFQWLNPFGRARLIL